MQDIGPYKDVRRDFFCSYFNKAKNYLQYGEGSNDAHWAKWKSYEKKVQLNPEQKQLISNFKRKINLLVLSGDWCGDCQRQGPMLYKIAELANSSNQLKDSKPLIDLRFIDNKKHPALQDELRINGAEKVPVAVFLTEDFLEVQRFGDKHLSVYRRLCAENNPAYCETGIGIDNIEDRRLELEISEWINLFERIQYLLSLSPLLKKRYND